MKKNTSHFKTKILQQSTGWLLIFALLGRLQAQKRWEIVKIRGTIYSDQTILRVGSIIKTDQYFTFNNTSDVMLVRNVTDPDNCHFAKPEKFAIRLEEGIPITNGKTNLQKCLKNINVFAFHPLSSRINTKLKCFGLLEEYKLLSTKCEDIQVDEKWEKFEVVKIGNYLFPGNLLLPKQYISSANCKYQLLFQKNGKLVLMTSDSTILWSINQVGDSCVMNDKGNLVIYGSNKTILWTSYSCTWSKNCDCSYLLLTDDGNLKIVAPNGIIKWETRTWGGTVNTNTLGHIVSAKKFTFDLRARYRVSSALDDQLLDVNMTTETKGIPVLTQNASNKNTQQWSIIRTLDLPYYQLKSNQIYYLGALPNGKNQLQLSLFDNTLNQQWDIAPAEEDGLFYIRNVNGLYLETLGNKGVQLSPFTGEKKQQWKFDPIK